MTQSLPPGWVQATLDQVARWGSGGTPSRTRPDFYGGPIPWIKTGELGKGVITRTEESITEEALRHSSAKVFPKGAVALAMYGATIGKASILGVSAATNQACAVGVPTPGITTSEFLLQYLLSQKDKLIEKGQGGAQPNISQGVVKSWPVPLPPLAEQQRISAKLSTLLARTELCGSRLSRVPQILTLFRESVLEAAVTGRLTEDHEPGWSKSSLQDLLQNGRKISYGVLKPGKEDPNGVRLIKSGQVRNGILDLAEDFRISQALSEEYGRTVLEGGEILLNLVGASIGRSAIAPAEVAGANVSRAIAVLPIKHEFTRWTHLVLSSPWGQRQIFADVGGSAQPVLNLSAVKDFQVPCPALEVRNEIVRRADELLLKVNALERRHAVASERIERLSPSLLAKAFRGELVPQDQADEPASVLLERVRKGREADGEKGERAKRSWTNGHSHPEPSSAGEGAHPKSRKRPGQATPLPRRALRGRG